jgi:hypothetical protein
MSDRHASHTHDVVDTINASRTEPNLLERRFAVGDGAGAYAVRLGDGDAAVLKWWSATPEHQRDSLLRLPRIERLRDRGWPIPHLLEAGSTNDALYEVWAVAPGRPGVHYLMPSTFVDQAVALLESAKGAALGDGGDWPSWITASIRASIEHAEPQASASALAVLAACSEAITAASLTRGKDIMHGDFGPANCLIEEDHILAVVDFDVCRDGDGTLDLIGLAWDLEGWEKGAPEVIDRLWNRIRRRAAPGSERVLLAYWIAGSLRWAAGTDWEDHIVRLSNRAWNRLT